MLQLDQSPCLTHEEIKVGALEASRPLLAAVFLVTWLSSEARITLATSCIDKFRSLDADASFEISKQSLIAKFCAQRGRFASEREALAHYKNMTWQNRNDDVNFTDLWIWLSGKGIARSASKTTVQYLGIGIANFKGSTVEQFQRPVLHKSKKSS